MLFSELNNSKTKCFQNHEHRWWEGDFLAFQSRIWHNIKNILKETSEIWISQSVECHSLCCDPLYELYIHFTMRIFIRTQMMRQIFWLFKVVFDINILKLTSEILNPPERWAPTPCTATATLFNANFRTNRDEERETFWHIRAIFDINILKETSEILIPQSVGRQPAVLRLQPLVAVRLGEGRLCGAGHCAVCAAFSHAWRAPADGFHCRL